MARSRTNQELRLSGEVQCFRLLFWSIMTVVYTPIIICISQYTALQTDVTCSIKSLYVPLLGGATNNRSIYFDLKLQNKLTEMRVCYDDLNITFHLYDENKSSMEQVANYTVHRFCQESLMTTQIRDHVDTYGAAFGNDFSEWKNVNKSHFRVNLQSKVRFELFWKSNRRKLKMGADVEVDKSTGMKVKEEGAILEFSRRDMQHFHLLRLLGIFLWICLILSLFCFPCFVMALLMRPVLAVIRSSKSKMLAQETLPLVNQLSSSSTSDIEKHDNLSLRTRIDSLIVDPSTTDVEQPSIIKPPNSDLEEIEELSSECDNMD